MHISVNILLIVRLATNYWMQVITRPYLYLSIEVCISCPVFLMPRHFLILLNQNICFLPTPHLPSFFPSILNSLLCARDSSFFSFLTTLSLFAYYGGSPRWLFFLATEILICDDMSTFRSIGHMCPHSPCLLSIQ